jgi:hypothetical protein
MRDEARRFCDPSPFLVLSRLKSLPIELARRGAKDRGEHHKAAGAIAQGALTTGLKVPASVYLIEIGLWKLESRSRKKAVA